MAFTASDLTKETYAFWNRPSEADLSQNDVLAIISRRVNRLLLMSQLTDKNYLAVLSPSFTFNGTERTKDLTFLDDISTVVRVESRGTGDTNDNNWSEEVIGDYGAWSDALLSRVNMVAFYGSSPDNLTMVVNRDVSSLEFRILYETGGVSLSSFSTAVPMLQELFRSTVFYGVAAEAGMMIDGLNQEAEQSRDKKVQYALGQESRSMDDFQKWLTRDPNGAVQYRESFNSTRQGAGQTRMFAQDGLGGYFSRY